MKKLVIIVLFCISNIAFSQNSQPDITETEFLNLKSEIKSLKISVDSLNQVTQNLTIENNKLQLTREFYKDILSTTIGFFGAFLTVISIIGAYISWLRNSNILRGAENIRNQMLEDFKKEIESIKKTYHQINHIKQDIFQIESHMRTLSSNIFKESNSLKGRTLFIQERYLESFACCHLSLYHELKTPNPEINDILENLVITLDEITGSHDIIEEVLKEIDIDEKNIKGLSNYKIFYKEYEEIMAAFRQRIKNIKEKKSFTLNEKAQIQSLLKIKDKEFNFKND